MNQAGSQEKRGHTYVYNNRSHKKIKTNKQKKQKKTKKQKNKKTRKQENKKTKKQKNKKTKKQKNKKTKNSTEKSSFYRLCAPCLGLCVVDNTKWSTYGSTADDW
jgi:hypothetical protein